MVYCKVSMQNDQMTSMRRANQFHYFQNNLADWFQNTVALRIT